MNLPTIAIPRATMDKIIAGGEIEYRQRLIQNGHQSGTLTGKDVPTRKAYYARHREEVIRILRAAEIVGSCRATMHIDGYNSQYKVWTDRNGRRIRLMPPLVP